MPITEALVQIDEIITMLEADVPANLNSPKNQKHERAYRAVMERYFRTLEQSFPYDSLDALYYQFVTMESRFRESVPYQFDEETGRILDPVLRILRNKLIMDTTGQHVTTYLAGIAQVTEWGKTLGGRPIYFEGPPIQQAIDYARDHCAEMVTKMDTETKRRLAKVISDGISNKRGIPGLSRDIRADILDMKRYRSEMIARTETNDALSQAFVDRSKALGVNGKEIVTHDPCPICVGNEGAGVIGIDTAFPSGHQRPPFHPNCRCALAPVMIKGPEPKAQAPEPTQKPVQKPEPTPVAAPVQKPEPVKPVQKPAGKSSVSDVRANFIRSVKAAKDEEVRDTLIRLRDTKIPDSHFSAVKSIEINHRKVQKVQGAMAYCDGGNNIVLAGKCGAENVEHEIGHAFFRSKFMVRGNQDKYVVMNIHADCAKTGKGLVSWYAKTDAEEFFAESYAAYAQNSKAFAKLNKPMADLLKRYWK